MLKVKGESQKVNLTVMQKADAPGDWHVGFLDGRPAVGNNQGEWFLLMDDAIIHNPGQRLIWLIKLEEGVWSCIHEIHWQSAPVSPPPIQADRPDYIEGEEA